MKFLLATFGVFFLTLGGSVANAAPIPEGTITGPTQIDITGTGFGSFPRLLTVHSTANQSTESGCVGLVNNQAVIGPGGCYSTVNVGDDEPPPRTISGPKYDILSLSSLGINTIADLPSLRIVFDATNPAGGSINMNNLTVKFFDTTGALVEIAQTSHDFSNTIAGNGDTGFAFNISSLPTFDPSLRIALEATFTGAHGGPESFFAYNASQPIPEPGTIVLMGAGLVAVGLLRRRVLNKG